MLANMPPETQPKRPSHVVTMHPTTQNRVRCIVSGHLPGPKVRKGHKEKPTVPFFATVYAQNRIEAPKAIKLFPQVIESTATVAVDKEQPYVRPGRLDRIRAFSRGSNAW